MGILLGLKKFGLSVLVSFLISLRYTFQSWSQNLEYEDLTDATRRIMRNWETEEADQNSNILKFPEKKPKILFYHPKVENKIYDW